METFRVVLVLMTALYQVLKTCTVFVPYQVTIAVIKTKIKMVEHGQVLGFAAGLCSHVNNNKFTAFMLCCSWCNGVKVGDEIRELLFSLPRMVEDQVRPVLARKLFLSSCTLYEGKDGDLCDSMSQKCLLQKSWM